MSKKKYKTHPEAAERQPTEVHDLALLVEEFMNRYDNIENELDLLKEDQKTLVEEYTDRLDMKTLKQAIRTVKIKKKVKHQDTYDAFCDILDKRENV